MAEKEFKESENMRDEVEKEIRKDLGIKPAQFLDVLTLMGDKADNVPGVPGIV